MKCYKTYKKSFLFILTFALIAILITLFCASCQSKDDSTNNSEAARFLNFNPEVAAYFKDAAKDFEAETGKKIVVDTAANGQYSTTLTAKMTTDEAPTLFVLGGGKDLINWKNYVTEIADTWPVKHLLDQGNALKGEDGNIYGVPYHMEGYGIIYNKKIMQKYFELPNRSNDINSTDEIKSFDQLKAVVEDMSSKKDALNIKGVFASTSLKNGHEFRWQTHLSNIPLEKEFEERMNEGRERFKTIDFRYSNNFKNIFDLYINNSIIAKKRLGTVAVTDSMTEFALGECAMVQNGNWAWGQINGVKNNTVNQDDLGFLPIYMGLPDEGNQGICIGTENYFAINSKSNKAQQQTALDFVEWLFSSKTGKDYIVNKCGFIAPFDTFSDQETPSNPLSKQVMQWMKNNEVNNVPWAFTEYPSQNFKNKYGQSLLRYAQDQKDWNTHTQLLIDLWAQENKASIYDK